MPTLTIKIAGRDAPLLNGSPSTFGHMWYSLDNRTKAELRYAYSYDIIVRLLFCILLLVPHRLA